MTRTKVVTIGGGTGSYTLLTGLKKYPYDITAIVTMADDGGSTGTLRDELGVLPPGDVRQCLVALSDATETLRTLMGYRFESGGLKGHNFGNLFLSALEKITGSFSAGVEEATRVLNVRGRVLPVSEGNMRLNVHLENGDVLSGEKELDDNDTVREVGIHKVTLAHRVHVNKDAVTAIEEADFVMIGPGDHFGSIVPNLLVAGIRRALRKTKAKIIFVAPLTNKRGHTGDFDVVDYVRAIEKYVGRGRIDYVLYNTKKPAENIIARYEKQEGSHSCVLFNAEAARDRTYRVVCDDLLLRKKIKTAKGDAIAASRAFIRHDSDKLARAVAFVIAHGGDTHIKIL